MKIGNIETDSKVFLAPMAGISDLIFRKICRNFGAGLVVTEMISAKAIQFENKKTYTLLNTDESEKPCAVQIFGSIPEIMGKTAKSLNSLSFDIIDINFGCPAPKIVKNGDGSALLKNPKLIGEIVKSVTSSTTKPVTAKIRLGFDNDSKNYLEVAKIIENAGASAITVHGRVRTQMYSGCADWEAISRIKETVCIPVIGNGDISTPEQALKRLTESGVDAIMIGRAALGNPWIFERCNLFITKGMLSPEPSVCEKISTALNHARDLLTIKGEFLAILEMRKHLSWYTKSIKGSSEARVKINTCCSFSEIENVLLELLKLNS